ncbi:MAG: tyrosine-protein phosphatase [Acidimicrobiales bacterium]
MADLFIDPGIDPFIEVDGTFNFRDVGGRHTRDGGKTRTGVLYRSAALDRLTERGRTVLDSLGIGLVVDVRSLAELERHGRFAFEGSSIEWHHVDSGFGPPVAAERPGDNEVFEADDPMSVVFRMIVEVADSLLATPLQLFARTDQPMVFHCTSGKDRTGFIAFLVQMIAGVDPEDAFEDFELSAAAMGTVRADMEARFPEMAKLEPHKLDRMAGADRRWIIDALDPVGGVGDLDPWLDSIGVDRATRDAIRRRFVMV